jgi:hypothetical protein
MHNDDSDDDLDDEDWYDEDDESYDDGDEESSDDTEPAHCPECSGPVYEFTNKCPACGYYLTAADRRRLFSSESKPKWVLITATVILIVLAIGALTLRF